MQLPAKLQKFLFQRAHLDPQFFRQLEQREIIQRLRDLLQLPAARTEMRSQSAFVAAPADQRRIRGSGWCAHLSLINSRPLRGSLLKAKPREETSFRSPKRLQMGLTTANSKIASKIGSKINSRNSIAHRPWPLVHKKAASCYKPLLFSITYALSLIQKIV